MIGDILQPTHLLFVLVVALLVLGPKRLPEAGRALGKGIRDFRSAISGEEDHHSAISPGSTAPPAPAPQAPPAAATQPVPQAQATPAAATQSAAPEEAPTGTATNPAEEPSAIAHPMG